MMQQQSQATDPMKLLLYLTICRTSFPAFVRVAFPVLHPDQKLNESWHIDAIAYALQLMYEGKASSRKVINLPPRSLKSQIISVYFVAWLLGQDPGLRIVCASYSSSLATILSLETRKLMQSPIYRTIFPGTRLGGAKDTEIEFWTTKRGYRLAASIGGGLTGRGGDWLILDDPLNASDTFSATARQNVMNWMNQTFLSRLSNPAHGKIIITHQRLHKEDLSGHMIGLGWPSLVMPLVATRAASYQIGRNKYHTAMPGDVLQPERNTPEAVERFKDEQGRHSFAAQYQQEPLPEAGDHLKPEYFRPFVDLNPNLQHKFVLSVDCAAKKGVHNDFTAITVWGACRDNLHLGHAVKGRWNVTETVAMLVALIEDYNITVVLIEDTGSGTAVIEMLERKGLSVEIIPMIPKDDKLTRLLRQMAKFERGLITVPYDTDWVKGYIQEMCDFPSGRHDDFVDSTVQFLEWAHNEMMCFEVPVLYFATRHPDDTVFI